MQNIEVTTRRIVRRRHFQEVYGFTTQWAYYQSLNNPAFPKPFKVESVGKKGQVSHYASAWNADELDAFFATQKAMSQQQGSCS